jgi:lycopene beta-cyclase
MRIDIAGAGAAGLSLALRLVRAGIPDLDLRLIDRDFSPASDRTWCFWDSDSLLIPGMVRKQWTRLKIDGPMGPLDAPICDHVYRMVDSGDFKRLALAELGAKNVKFETTDVRLDALDADHVFQSVVQPTRTEPWLKQHFLGIELRADRPVFEADVATIMDFNVSQSHGFAFMYLLPISDTHALLEYTLFTD